MSKWIGVDLDGTLAEHYWPQKGEYDPYRIGDPLMPMVRSIRDFLREGIEVRIFTARVGPHGSAPPHVIPNGEDIERIRAEIRSWTKLHIGTPLEATCIKDYDMFALYDDRAIRVMHNTGKPCCKRIR